MASIIKNRLQGLFTSPNSLGSVPPGSLLQADDVVIDDDGVASCRPGFQTLAGTFGTSSSRANVVAVHRGADLLVGYDTNKLAYSTDAGATFNTYSGTYSAKDSTLSRVRIVGADDQSYVATSTGLKVISSTTATTPADAGVPPGTFMRSFLSDLSPWMLPNTAVAYRYTLVRYQDGKPVEGRPSGRQIVSTADVNIAIGGLVRVGINVTATTTTPHNFSSGMTVTLNTNEANFASGPKVVTYSSPLQFTYTEAGAAASSTVTHTVGAAAYSAIVYCYLPGEAQAGVHYIRLYRSPASATASTTPSDECFQVQEYGPLTNTDIVNGYRPLSADTTPESQLSNPLYTNPNTGGEDPNERPPLAGDITLFDGRLFYGNTVSRHRLQVELLGCGSPSGVQVGDTVTTDMVFTAVSGTTTPAARQFNVFTAGTPSQNIRDTLTSLIFSMKTAGSAYNAFAVSGDNESPGKLLLEEQSIGGAAFTFSTSRTSAWSPSASAGTPANSSNDLNHHWVWYSKPAEPEAVPLLNYLPVGSKNAQILRIFGFKSVLYVFKQDGIWAVTGPAPYQVSQISAAKLLVSESVCVLNESVWVFTDQGVSVVNDAGVSVVSRPIEKDLRDLFTTANTSTLAPLTFAVGQESTRRYILWVPSSTTSTGANYAFVYNFASQTWTKWLKSARTAIVHPITDRLIQARAGTNKLSQTRSLDANGVAFSDEEFTTTFVSASGKVLTVTSTASINVGDYITDGGGNTGWVVSVDSSTTMTISDRWAGVASTLTIYPAITSIIKWNGLDFGDPGLTKTISDLELLFDPTTTFRGATVSLKTDLVPASTDVTISSQAGFGFDSFSYGYYGGTAENRQRISPLPPGSSACGTLYVTFTVAQGRSTWRLLGLRAEAAAGSEKSKR